VDNDRFDRFAVHVSDASARSRIVRGLAKLLSRRSLVGGSLGAAALALAGGSTTRGRVIVERCIPPGRRCGTRPTDRPCRECCQRFHIVTKKGVKKCACRPFGARCQNPAQCCGGLCENNECRSAPCRAVDAACEVDSDCCSKVCGAVSLFPPVSVRFCRESNCQQPGGDCAVDADCCTELCFEGQCEEP
jgi:hypothetical protein